MSRIAVPFLAVLLVSACGVPQQAAPPATAPSAAPSSAPPAGTPTGPSTSASPGASRQDTRPALAETRSTLTQNLKVEAVGLNRVKGRHLVIQLRLTNTDTDKQLPWTGEMGEIRWASGIGVLDAPARTWILRPARAGTSGACSSYQRRRRP
jgi:hypothetical protein